MTRQENLDAKVYTTALTVDEVAVLDGFKQDDCSLGGGGKNHWYECCGDPKVQASIPSC